MPSFTPRQLELLQSEKLARLATASRDGVPHATTIWFFATTNYIYFATDESTKKLRNLKANPEVSVVVDDGSWNPTRSLTINGRAEILFPGTPDFEAVYEMLCQKYPPEREYKSPNSRIVRVVPRRIITWEK